MEIKNDKHFLEQAIEKSRKSISKGGFPVGAVIVKGGKIVGEGLSIGNLLHDATSHGEMAAIRDACKKIEATDLSDTVLYASMEPCLMCFGAAMWTGISKIVFAIAKEVVSPEYYRGDYEIAAINSKLATPIEIVHLNELENEALAIVTEWENQL